MAGVIPLRLPDAVIAFAGRGAPWTDYVGRLPGLVAELIEEWRLVVDGAPLHGSGSLVVPVHRDGEPAMLKLAFPDDEGEHEALGLQRWGGQGAARLLAADPHRSALLLERLHATDLESCPVLDACEVVAGLYRRLHVAAPARLRTLTSYVDRWNQGLAALPRDAPVPHRLVRQALARGRDLATDPASVGVLLHGDLHYQNVLAADREPWLVIDPKPMSGDPHYEPAPMLWNRWDEAVASGDLRFALRRRFHTLVDVAGLDEERARDWVLVRMMHNALWELQDAAGERRAPDADWLTMCVAVAKAVHS